MTEAILEKKNLCDCLSGVLREGKNLVLLLK